MNSKRLTRVNDEIRKELSEIIRSDIKDPRLGMLTSVTKVETSSDLAVAKVYISVLGNEEETKNALEGLKSASGFMRRELASRLNLRNTPEIRLFIDDTLTNAARISKLIDDANKKED